jgi:hypothetical protein
MAAQIGEGRRYRQSKIDFSANLLLWLRFPGGITSHGRAISRGAPRVKIIVTISWHPRN